MRNRQFSYDEGEDDYYDEEEEDRLIEEHRLQMLEARGDASGGRGGGISLSSYFDDLPGSTPQLQQQSEPPQQRHGGSEPPGHTDRHAPDKSHQSAGGEDAELIAAIAAELENRLERGRFSADQVRQAVQTSGYEVDTAEAILLSTGEAAATGAAASEPQVQFPTGRGTATGTSGGGSSSSKVGAAPTGLPPTAAGYDNHPPSSLAFGLCVDGRPATTTTDDMTTTTTSSSSRAGISASSAAAAAGLEQFGFDTPSPDDLNLSKQAAARGRGGGAGGNNVSRNTDAFSSPKAKVVHIQSGSTPKSTGGRKSVSGPPSAAATTPTPTKGRAQSSPAVGGGVFSPSPQQSAAAAAAAQAIDDIDDAQAGGKERLAMVVIGHVDAGKSTLMGQVSVWHCFIECFFCILSCRTTRKD